MLFLCVFETFMLNMIYPSHENGHIKKKNGFAVGQHTCTTSHVYFLELLKLTEYAY